MVFSALLPIFGALGVTAINVRDHVSTQNRSFAFVPYASYQKNVDFGLPYSRMNSLVDSVCVSVYQSDFTSPLNVESLAKRLLIKVDQALFKASIEKPNRLLKQWLVAEAISAWVVSKVDSDLELAREKDFSRWWNGIRPEATLQKQPPTSICSGTAWLARDLARALKKETGIDARYVGGWLRSDNGQVPTASNHAWTVFVFDGGIEVPADTVPPLESVQLRRSWTAKRGAWPILPRTAESWEIFLAFHYGVEAWKGSEWARMPEPVQDPFSKLDFRAWSAKLDVSTALWLRRNKVRPD